MNEQQLQLIKILLLLSVSFIAAVPLGMGSDRLSYFFQHVGLYSESSIDILEIERQIEENICVDIPSYNFLLDMLGKKDNNPKEIRLDLSQKRRLPDLNPLETENTLPDKDEINLPAEPLNQEKEPPIKTRIPSPPTLGIF